MAQLRSWRSTSAATSCIRRCAATRRVTVLEDTDWRHLSLNEAEGPFDFFTVDVSFVSARNMLRGLAFRLRPGAQGVVLVKPQFELPDRQVKGGEVRDQNLRQAAVDRVRKRGEALGFQLLAEVDSPVAGREGSIEILAHLKFEGRSERLPAPGERRPHQPRARRKAAGPEALRWFAVVAPGLEPAAEHEVRALEGATNVAAVPGGVEWTAPALGGLEANLWLRTVTRVLARVGSVEAREFGKLRRRAAGLPWDRFLSRGATVSIRASATAVAPLPHGRAGRDRGAGHRRCGAGCARRDEGPRTSQRRRCWCAARRTGSRSASMPPASAFTGAARASRSGPRRCARRWRPGCWRWPVGIRAQPLCDPVCGAGTIAIEAALQAVDRAPGLDREFALEDWPLLAASSEPAAALRERARARVRPTAPAPIAASDRDPAVIESAARNAARAGVAEQIAFACRDLGDARPPSEQGGLVIANPPYGRRLGDPRAAVRVYRDLGRLLRAHFRGWRAAVVVPARLPGAADALRLTLPDHHRLRNGGLPIELRVGRIT